MQLQLSTICRKLQNRHFLRMKYLSLILKLNKFMFAYIIILQRSIGHIFARPIGKILDSAKVMVCQRVIQCTPGGSCKKRSVVQVILKINF